MKDQGLQLILPTQVCHIHVDNESIHSERANSNNAMFDKQQRYDCVGAE